MPKLPCRKGIERARDTFLRLCAAGAGNDAHHSYAELQAGISMECWACGFLTASSESLHRLDVEHVTGICVGGWGFTLLHVEGTRKLYGKQACLPAGMVTHPTLSWQTPSCSAVMPIMLVVLETLFLGIPAPHAQSLPLDICMSACRLGGQSKGDGHDACCMRVGQLCDM